MPLIKLTVTDEYEGLRVDRFISEQLDDLSRSYLQKLIKDEFLTVNGLPVKASCQVSTDDLICIDIPQSREPSIEAEDIDLDILFEDNDIIVINKPKGMVVHPSAGHYSGTVVNALMYHCKDNLSGINGILRPGIVHRIDMDTSGIIVCAKSDAAHKSLSEQFKEHSISRTYEAICVGRLKSENGTISAPIGRNPNNRKLMAVNEKNGKSAVTHYKVLKDFNKYSYIQLRLETGRTHQIRVHMASIDHPLLGDIKYGGKLSEFKLNKTAVESQTLHAKLLGFKHPVSGKYMEFSSELPEYFKEILCKLQNE